MARLLADANFPRPVTNRLRRLGHDIKTVQQVEGTSRPENPMTDAQVLSLATQEKRAVLTLNVTDFEAEADQQPGHEGIVACRLDLDSRRQARQIDRAIKGKKHLTAQIIYITPPGRKARKKR
jgi:hypothetical protein